MQLSTQPQPDRHLALARKWRPKCFAKVVGQEHVVRTLRSALAQGRLHHAFMFTGTRGIGKTTLARILAKACNCENGAPEGEPCCECSSCQQIDAGTYPDVIEIDAASTTQVENMRELLDGARYVPVTGRYKIYIIDEVHMLSRHSFNAMLKTLEEPPDHVKFILATTDPQQVPATVQSRCLRFSLRRLARELIDTHLQEILIAEGYEFEPAAVAVIASLADGSVRDALSILDEAVSLGAKLREDEVRELVGVAGFGQVATLLQLVIKGDAKAALELAAQMYAQAVNFDNVLTDMIELVHRSQLAALAPDLGTASSQTVSLDPLAAQLAYEIASQARERLATAPDAKVAFDMTLLRMITLFASAQQLTVPAPTAVAAARPAALSAAADLVPAAVPPPPPPGAARSLPAVSGIPATADEWKNVCMRLDEVVKSLAEECAFIARKGNQLTLSLARENEVLLRVQDRLAAELSKLCGTAVHLQINVQGNHTAPTAGAEIEAETAARRASAVQELEKSAAVQLIKDKMPGSKVDKNSVKLL